MNKALPLHQQNLPDWSRHPRIQRAAAVVRGGGVVAYPTEAVWGLGCDPSNRDAVEHILKLKQRPVGKGLILLAANIEMLRPYLVGLDQQHIAQMQSTWPGPVTWLIPNNGIASDWISGGQSTLAVRVSAHPVAAGLSRALDTPIVSTSANPRGRQPATSLTRVKVYFSNTLDDCTPGTIGNAARPSEIRDMLTGKIVRPG